MGVVDQSLDVRGNFGDARKTAEAGLTVAVGENHQDIALTVREGDDTGIVVGIGEPPDLIGHGGASLGRLCAGRDSSPVVLVAHQLE